jgi:hypothetical protein
MKKRGAIDFLFDFHGAVDPVMHERLENWGRVVRGWTGPRRHVCMTAVVCESLAKLRGFVETADEVRIPTDQHDGWLLERTWRNPGFPKREKTLLRCHYILRLPPQGTARLGGVPMAEFSSRMLNSVAAMRNRLAKYESRRILHAKFDPPLSEARMPANPAGVAVPAESAA